jgi:hypothetical protein
MLETFSAYVKNISEGTQFGSWNVVYNGYGMITPQLDGLHLMPKISTAINQTSACLVTGPTILSNNFTLQCDMQTIKQLRMGSSPNAWEVAWLLFNYIDNKHFYYVALKPNGIELGKEDPAYVGAQRFLATDSSHLSAIGSTNHICIIKTNAIMNVLLNNISVITFTDVERPYTTGKIALYTEDAHVRFNNISLV